MGNSLPSTMTIYHILELFSSIFYKPRCRVKVYFQHQASVEKACVPIVSRLHQYLNFVTVRDEAQCEALVVFCPIVSRAGTDIEATLSRLSVDKPTVVFVLHHTFDPEYNAPNSSGYDRKDLVMVDILFHEDSGLLNCSKNNIAISKAGNYLMEPTKSQLEVCPKRVFLGIGIVGIPTIFLAYRQFGLGNVVLGSVATGVIAFVLYRILKKKSN